MKKVFYTIFLICILLTFTSCVLPSYETNEQIQKRNEEIFKEEQEKLHEILEKSRAEAEKATNEN